MALLLSTMWFGVMAMAYSLLVSTMASMVINSWPNRMLLHYSLIEQLKDILPGIFISLIMGVCVLIIGILPLPVGGMLILQVCAGAAVYTGLSAFLKLESFEYLHGMMRGLRTKSKT